MERNNVCKFNPYRSSDLICLNFIKEFHAPQVHFISKTKSTSCEVLFVLRRVDKKDANFIFIFVMIYHK